MRRAAPTPCSSRPAKSQPRSGAAAHNSDAAANSAIPMMSSLRRPYKSPAAPPMSSSALKGSRYPLMIQERFPPAACSPRPMAGSPTLTIDPSMNDRLDARMVVASTSRGCAAPCANTILSAIEPAEDGAEDYVGDDDDHRRADAVVQRERTGRLQLAHLGRALVHGGHARVDRRQQRDDDEQNHHCLQKAQGGAAQESRASGGVEDCHIEKREDLAVDQVGEEAKHLGAVAVGGDRGAEQIGDAHSREVQRLRACLQRGEHQRSAEAGEKGRGQAQGCASGTRKCWRCISCLPRSARPRNESAALISPTWV